MPIKIFENPDVSENDTGTNDIVGRFRSGHQLNDRPIALREWRVTTGDPDVAGTVAELLNAEEPYSEWETQTDEIFEIFGSESKVDVLFDGPGAVRATFVVWGRKGKLLETDGTHLIEDGKVTDQICQQTYGKTLKEIKAEAAKTGIEPSLQAYFRLAADPDLGKFKFFSGSWTAIDYFDKAETKLAEIDGPAKGTLELELVEWTDKQTGQERSYTRPKIKVTGAVE